VCDLFGCIARLLLGSRIFWTNKLTDADCCVLWPVKYSFFVFIMKNQCRNILCIFVGFVWKYYFSIYS